MAAGENTNPDQKKKERGTDAEGRRGSTSYQSSKREGRPAKKTNPVFSLAIWSWGGKEDGEKPPRADPALRQEVFSGGENTPLIHENIA